MGSAPPYVSAICSEFVAHRRARRAAAPIYSVGDVVVLSGEVWVVADRSWSSPAGSPRYQLARPGAVTALYERSLLFADETRAAAVRCDYAREARIRA